MGRKGNNKRGRVECTKKKKTNMHEFNDTAVSEKG